MFRCGVLVICCLVALTSALTKEQKDKIHEHFATIGAECIKEVPITEDDINSLRSKQMPKGENGPCFMACMLKKVGVMDDKGMLHKENVLESAKKVFEDPEEIKNIEEYLHSCASVNSEAVSDGEKGCDRAVLAFKCMKENASKFGFDV